MREYILLFNPRRRVYMVEKIREYLAELNINVGLYVTDTDRLDPIGYHSEKFSVLPPIESENFDKIFLEFVKQENIKYIFLWNNKDFYKFDSLKDELNSLNVKILIPPIEKINYCYDKIETYRFCVENNINTPKTYKSLEDFDKNPCEFPVMVKPINGAGNLNVCKADNREELNVLFKKVPHPFIQEYIDGEHYTIDTFYDKKTIVVVPRKRVKVRDAEVVEASIDMSDYLLEYGKKVTDAFGYFGPMNIQVIVKNKKPYLIDMHSRFGGGTDLTIESGVPIHKWIVNYLLDLEKNYDYKINDKLFMTRYLKSEFFEV